MNKENDFNLNSVSYKVKFANFLGKEDNLERYQIPGDVEIMYWDEDCEEVKIGDISFVVFDLANSYEAEVSSIGLFDSYDEDALRIYESMFRLGNAN